MKTDATELAHCIESVRRHALARPDVGFAIWHEGKLVEQWRATFVPGEGNPQDALARRLSDVLGEDFVAQSVAVQHRVGPVTVTGRAGLARRRPFAPDHQYCYVSGRFVRDKVLTTPPAPRMKTCCTATSSPSTRCMSRSTRPRGRERAPHQDRGALSGQPRRCTRPCAMRWKTRWPRPRSPGSGPGRTSCG